jgi:hypothetical protein
MLTMFDSTQDFLLTSAWLPIPRSPAQRRCSGFSKSNRQPADQALRSLP